MPITKTFKKNEVIFNEGDVGRCLYNIAGDLEARVGIYADYATPDQVLLTSLKVDEFFGEMALLGHETRSATAVALTDCVLEMVTKDEFEEFAVKNPIKLEVILKNAASRLRDLTNDYVKACFIIKEYSEAKESGGRVSDDLIAKMKKIVK